MGFLNENITWAFFVYSGQLLSGLSLIVGFFKNFGIVIVFSWLFSSWRWTKLAMLQYFCAGLRWRTVERQSFLAYFIQYTEDKRRNGDFEDIIFVLLSGLILKAWLCCHLCPKSGLIFENSPLLLPMSRKWTYFLKTRLCCHLCPESGLISENSPLLPPLSKK